MKLRSVFKGTNRLFLLLFVANGFSNFVQFASSLLLAKELGPEQFGVFSFFVALAQSLSLFIDLGLCATVVRLASGKPSAIDRRQLLLATTGVQFIVYVLLLMILLPFGSKLLYLFQQPHQSALFSLAIVMAGTIVLQWLIRSSLEISQQIYFLAGFTALYAVLRSILFVLVYFQFEADLRSYFAALYVLPLALTCGVYLVVLALRYFEDSKKPVGESAIEDFSIAEAVTELFHYGKWMLSQPMYSMLYLVPIYILTRDSAYELGIYSAAFTFSAIFALINTSVRQITMPMVSRFTTRNELNDYIAKVRRLTIPALLGVALIVFAMAAVMVFVLDDRYTAGFSVFCVLGFGMGLTILLGQYNIISHVFRRPDLLMQMTVVQFIALILLSSAAVSWLNMGALGAASSVALVLLGGEVWLYFRLWRLRRDPKVEINY